MTFQGKALIRDCHKKVNPYLTMSLYNEINVWMDIMKLGEGLCSTRKHGVENSQ